MNWLLITTNLDDVDFKNGSLVADLADVRCPAGRLSRNKTRTLD
jgi:hypothetical protein